AGVAAAVAHALAFPIMGVRLAFVALTFVHFLGAIVYGALWLLVPFTPGEPSPLERGLATAQEWVGHLRGATTPPPQDVPSSPPSISVATGIAGRRPSPSTPPASRTPRATEPHVATPRSTLAGCSPRSPRRSEASSSSATTTTSTRTRSPRSSAVRVEP